MKYTFTDLATDIITGNLDSDLSRIVEAVRERQHEIKDKQARVLRLSLEPGATVYFVSTCHPTYLRGVKAIVRKLNPKKVVVDLLQPAGRFHKGIICPPTLLTTTKP
jgi:hypothetical protein